MKLLNLGVITTAAAAATGTVALQNNPQASQAESATVKGSKNWSSIALALTIQLF